MRVCLNERACLRVYACQRTRTAREPHHHPGVVQVPGEGRHALVLGVHDGVLYDVDAAGQVGGKEPLGPAGQPVRLGQESAGQEPMVPRHLAEDHVLRENVGAERRAGNRRQPFWLNRNWNPHRTAWQTLIQSQ